MNNDRLQRFPHQVSENRFNFCVAHTIADLIGNKHYQPYDPDFSYAAALAVQSLPPHDGPIDLDAAFLAACVWGSLPDHGDLRDPIDTSAIHEADFRNYTQQQKELAAYFTRNGIKKLYTYDAIKEHLLTARQGVALGMRWYQSFNYPYPDGTLRTPTPGESFTSHCVAVYEADDRGLRIKPWMGPEYGEKGYGFLPRRLFTDCRPTGIAFDDDASRFYTLVSTALWRYPKSLRALLPMILSSARIKTV